MPLHDPVLSDELHPFGGSVLADGLHTVEVALRVFGGDARFLENLLDVEVVEALS